MCGYPREPRPRTIPGDARPVKVAIEGAEFRKRKVRARFSFNRELYQLSVTDPIVERRYLMGQDGEYYIGEAVLCISLGELYEGFAYKLVAAIFLPS